jgi:hypothetical protein
MLHRLMTRLLRSRIDAFAESPVFIVGTVRSGTTALLNALGCHPAILTAHRDAPLLHHVGRMMWAYRFGERSGYYQNSTACASQTLRRHMRDWAFETVWGPPRRFCLRPRHLGRKDHLCALGRRSQRWAVKAFPEEADAQGLCWLMPRSGFVYIVRNGIEVVHSMGRFPSFRAMDMRSRCRLWADRVWAYRYLQDHPRAVTIRHEDFLADPDTALAPLWPMLGVAYDPDPARYAASTLVHPLEREDTTHTPARHAITTRPSPWQSWDERDKAVFRQECGEAMRLLGYTME